MTKHIKSFLFLLSLTLLIFTFSTIEANASDPEFEWAKQLIGIDGGSNWPGYSSTIIKDNDENIYVVGLFYSSVDFDPGESDESLTSAGSVDIYVLKLDSSGNYVWAKKVGGTGGDRGYSIIVDDNSNIYVTGYFSGTVNFDPNEGTSNLTSAGSSDIYVLKLDSSGNYVWAKKVGGTGGDEGYSLDIDENSNVYITGYFSDTADFDPGDNTHNLTSAGGDDTFILKLDSFGNYVWVKGIIGAGDSGEGDSLYLDENSNVYITGYFSDTADFDPGDNTHNLTSAGGDDTFILKLDSFGNYLWSGMIYCPDSDYPYSIYIDSSNNIFIAGEIDGIADVNPNEETYELDASVSGGDTFILKLSQNTAPNATSITISGNPNIGQTLTGSYIYTDDDDDQEGISTYRWLRDDTIINGATSTTYTVTADDLNMTIKFEVTPVASTGSSPGEAVLSAGVLVTVAQASLTTDPATSIERTTATLNGNVTSTGGADITERGFNYGTTTSYGTNTTETGTFQTGSFTTNLTNLSCNTTYHFRTYAINSAGTAYGLDQTFTTSKCKTSSSGSYSSGSKPTTEPTTATPPPTVPPTVPTSCLPGYLFNPLTGVSCTTVKTDSTPSSTTCTISTILTRTIKLTSSRMTGDDIKSLQAYLNCQGYNSGIADGIYGPITKQAVIKFQLANGLVGDGIVGKLTIKAMQ